MRRAEAGHAVELLGPKLRSLRKERKLSPEALAGQVGLEVQELLRLERGEARLDLETLLRFLSEFHIDPGELVALETAAAARSAAVERFRRDLSGG